jgi:hypothetical protein
MIGPVLVLQDSVVVESPLPGGAAEVFRFLFNFPQWLQIAGFFVGLVVAFFVARHLWQRREPILTWIKTRSRGLKWALGSSIVVGVLVAIAAGGATWNYMQHDNDFCTGCHIMESPFRAFGSGAGRHEDRNCHDCHQQSIRASARQFVIWVAERPEEIKAHAPVPNERCDECHATGQDSTWQRVATTAGHRTHLESDSSDLADVLCVTCHGQEIHSFVPVAQTCGQSGCHLSEDTEFILGRMAEQTDAHCTECHQFTADVPLLATLDSARGTLVPNDVQCFSCHEMETLLADFNPRLDPHSSTCGMCHDPHTQEQAVDASQTCQDCHTDWQDVPFHVGDNHIKDAESCLTCHPAHASKVDASDCVGCHKAVNETGTNRHAPLPFDTTAALLEASGPSLSNELLAVSARWSVVRRLQATPRETGSARTRPTTDQQPLPTSIPISVHTSHPEPRRGKGDVLPGPAPPLPSRTPIDTFPHDPHEALTCIECHVTEEGHGGLTFEQPRGCDICHHRGPSTNDCAVCHQQDDLAAPYGRTFAVTVEDQDPRSRSVDFAHEIHAEERCVDCHQEPVSLALDTQSATCQACHADHHEAATQCAQCHRTDAVLGAHTVAEGHDGCDECHTQGTIAVLVPERPFCLVCHEDDVDHYPETEKPCTVCHLQDEPEDYRHLLLSSGR